VDIDIIHFFSLFTQKENEVMAQPEVINQPPEPQQYGKPGLPTIPESIRAHAPKPSGKCPGLAVLLMFIVAPVISLVLGVAAHYLGIAVGFVGGIVAAAPTLLTSVCGFISWFLVIFGFVVVVMVYLGYPYLVGFLNGGLVVANLGKKGLCRNPGVAGLAGLINGVAVYLGHTIIALIVSKTLHPLTFTVERLENIFETGIEGVPVWIYIICFVELVMLVIGGFVGAKNEIKESTFCEKHQTWYGKWKQAQFPLTIKEELAQAVSEMNPVYLEHTERVAKETYPHILIQYRCCPGGDACDMELRATLWWKERTVDKKGKETITNKSEVWFDTLLPADFVKVLVEKLHLDSVQEIKKS
jgi:hypothetical protein